MDYMPIDNFNYTGKNIRDRQVTKINICFWFEIEEQKGYSYNAFVSEISNIYIQNYNLT